MTITPVELDDITRGFDDDFYDGAGSSNEVPDRFDIALGGRTYMLDQAHPAFGGQSAYLSRMGIESIPFIRQQADNSDEPGAATLNPDDLWTRAQSSWHHGAGQQYLDAPDSDRERFRTSFGIDPWTRGQLNPLNQVASIYATASINVRVLRVGTFLYVCDGTALKYANAPYSSFTTWSATPGQQINSMCSDGNTIYLACGSAGVYKATRGTNAGDGSYNALVCTLIDYVNGRLMAANGASIFNITSGSTPTALFTAPNTDFTWVGFAEGHNAIYSAGYSGDKSIIYRNAVKTDGSGLDVSFVAGTLPDGEIVSSIAGYQGFIFIASNKGVRMATADSSGNLTLGALITTNTKVRCFEPQDRFIWFGYENFDAFHTGLGRMDVSIVDSSGAPAYATDLMAGTTASAVQGPVLSIATDNNGVRVFSVQGVGVFLEQALTPVATGYMYSGQYQFGVVAPKIALRASVKHKPLAADADVQLYVAGDDGSLIFCGQSDVDGATSTDGPMTVPELAASLFEIQIVLDGAVTFEHYEFKAYPSSERGSQIHVPILLHEKVKTATGDEIRVDVAAEYDYIKSYEGSSRLISYQELGRTFSVFVEDVNYQRVSPTSDRKWWNGTCLVVLKVLGG